MGSNRHPRQGCGSTEGIPSSWRLRTLAVRSRWHSAHAAFVAQRPHRTRKVTVSSMRLAARWRRSTGSRYRDDPQGIATERSVQSAGGKGGARAWRKKGRMWKRRSGSGQGARLEFSQRTKKVAWCDDRRLLAPVETQQLVEAPVGDEAKLDTLRGEPPVPCKYGSFAQDVTGQVRIVRRVMGHGHVGRGNECAQLQGPGQPCPSYGSGRTGTLPASWSRTPASCG